MAKEDFFLARRAASELLQVLPQPRFLERLDHGVVASRLLGVSRARQVLFVNRVSEQSRRGRLFFRLLGTFARGFIF